jgi:DNA-binding response OmpR family regulator
MSRTILVVDDERNIVELARMYLRNEGFEIEAAYNGREALEKARALQPSLVLLDIMMPEVDGLEVMRTLRKETDIPVVMLTARADDVDKVVGLELGADDYITKPFNPRELVARVKAVLRRTESGPRRPSAIEVGDLTIDVAGREAQVAGRGVPLRTKEFDLLVALAENTGVAMARDRLLNTVWGEDFFGDARTLDVHIAWLRDKISGATAKIVTVWGFGYKLVVQDDVPDAQA